MKEKLATAIQWIDKNLYFGGLFLAIEAFLLVVSIIFNTQSGEQSPKNSIFHEWIVCNIFVVSIIGLTAVLFSLYYLITSKWQDLVWWAEDVLEGRK